MELKNKVIIKSKLITKTLLEIKKKYYPECKLCQRKRIILPQKEKLYTFRLLSGYFLATKTFTYMKIIGITLFLLTALVAVNAQNPVPPVNPAPAGPRHRPVFNPLEPMVHDPVMAKDGDTYYLFCTGMGISQLTTKDMKSWIMGKPVFQQTPSWVKEYLSDFRGHIWAPDIIYYQGKFHLFYSCSAFAKNTSLIGHATSTTLNPEDPAYGWTDQGLVLQSVPNRDMWNAIDPNIIVDENGTPWMDFGSFWDGIKLVKLTNDMMSVAKPEEWYSLCRRPRTHTLDDNNPGDGAVEAPFIFRHGKYYYLFVSFDYCCRGLKSDYNIVVGRSEKVTGPYIDKEGISMSTGGGTVIMKGDDKWAGAGHCAVYNYDNIDYLIAHGYSKAENGASKLIIREIEWGGDEWPMLIQN